VDVCKKKECSEEEESEEVGKQWVSAAIDPESKVIVAHNRGGRDELSLTKLVQKTRRRLKSPLDVLYVSDEWDAYALALKNVFGHMETPPRRRGPGRPRKPKIVVPDELKYAVVHKTRKGSKVTKVERRIVYGDKGEILDILERSPVSKTINTSFIERGNLTLRHLNRRLTRKTPGFSKASRLLDCQLTLSIAYYHFALPHGGLTIKKQGEKAVERTPFMAAGLTDKIWSLEDLTRYVPV